MKFHHSEDGPIIKGLPIWPSGTESRMLLPGTQVEILNAMTANTRVHEASNIVPTLLIKITLVNERKYG